MNGQVTLTGMVLGTMPISEYDKRLVILTLERGKITTFAKNARKQNSQLMACSQPFTFGKFTLYEGKNSYNLVSAEISNYFMKLRDNLEMIAYGMYMLEFADYYTRENSDDKLVLKLLYQSCRAIESGKIELRLIRFIFELKMITINGEISDMRECDNCGGSEELIGVSISEGQVVCKNCKAYVNDFMALSNSAIYTIQFIIYTSIEKLFTFMVTKEVLNELISFMDKYIKRYIDKKFNSLEMLEIFKD